MIGQSVGSDASPLSCFLFRPRKRLEKRRKRSHTNVSNASVTRTSRVSQTPLQTPIPYFHQWVPHGKKTLVAIACKTAYVCFHRRKWVYTLGFPRKIAHKGLHGETGAFRMGALLLPSERFARFGNPAWPGVRTAYFAALGSWPGGALEERRKPSGQRCAYARRCPTGLRDPVSALLIMW